MEQWLLHCGIKFLLGQQWSPSWTGLVQPDTAITSSWVPQVCRVQKAASQQSSQSSSSGCTTSLSLIFPKHQRGWFRVLFKTEHSTVIYSQHFDQLRVSRLTIVYCKQKLPWSMLRAAPTRGININRRQFDSMSTLALIFWRGYKPHKSVILSQWRQEWDLRSPRRDGNGYVSHLSPAGLQGTLASC